MQPLPPASLQTNENSQLLATIGERLKGEFELLALVSVEERALVFRARAAGTKREVILKVFHPPSNDAGARQRFAQEMRVHATVLHTGVQPLLATGEMGGISYFTIPSWGQDTLQTWRQQSHADVRERLVVFRDICETLAALHTSQFLHADLRAENVLVAEGHAVIVGFGRAQPLATAQQSRSDLHALGYLGLLIFSEHSSDIPEHVTTTRRFHLAFVQSKEVERELSTILKSLLAEGTAHLPCSAAEATDSVNRLLEKIGSVAVVNAPGSTHQLRKVLIGIAAVLSAVAVALQFTGKQEAVAPVVRMAVLPFDDLTPSSGYGWLASGLTHEFIDELSLTPKAWVASFEVGNSAKKAGISFDSLRKALNIGIIATGALERLGSHVRITVRLTDLRPDAASPVKFESEADTNDVDRLRDAVAGEIAAQFRRAVGAGLARNTTRVASEIGLGGWPDFQRAEAQRQRAVAEIAVGRGGRATVAILDLADSLYRDAMSKGTRWNKPRIALARSYGARADLVADTSRNQCTGNCVALRERAIALADSALLLESNNVEALEVRGIQRFALSFAPSRVKEAEKLFEDASADLKIVTNKEPERASAWIAVSEMRSRRGNAAGAEDALEMAENADPWLALGPEVQQRAITNYVILGAEQPARTRCERARHLYKDDALIQECALTVLGFWGSGSVAIDSAWQEFRRTTALRSDSIADVTWWFRRAMVAKVIARSDKRDSAYNVLQASRRLRPTDDPNLFFQEALVQAVAGDTTRLAASLSAYLKARPTGSSLVLRERLFATYHDTPWFRRIIESTPAR
ncbi:MAG: protein kinase [Gemmatimonadaceae bacterium]